MFSLIAIITWLRQFLYSLLNFERANGQMAGQQRALTKPKRATRMIMKGKAGIKGN